MGEEMVVKSVVMAGTTLERMPRVSVVSGGADPSRSLRAPAGGNSKDGAFKQAVIDRMKAAHAAGYEGGVQVQLDLA